MKKSLLAAASLLTLVAFGAQATEDGAKMESVKDHAAKVAVTKHTESSTTATTEAAKPADAAPAAGEATKEVTTETKEVTKEVKKEEAK